jgi:tetratricopeptide (TPR) repeat protein
VVQQEKRPRRLSNQALPRETKAISRSGVAAIAIAALCLVLAWAVVGETVADVLAKDSPGTALAWRPAYAGALQSLAEDATNNAVTGSEIAEAEKSAQASLKASPMSAASLHAVAVAKQLKGDAAGALTLMTLAGQRNQRNQATNLWLFNENLRAGRYPEAFRRADLMLRRRPDDQAMIYQTLISVIDRPGAMAALLQTLKEGQAWRADFLRTLSEQGDPGGVALRIMLALRVSSHPPLAAEVQPLLTSLTNQGRYQQAHQVWLSMNQTDPNQPAIFDGGFEQPRRVPPFDWRLVQNGGVTASVELIEGGAGHALYGEYPTGADALLAEQMLVLAPGAYRFTGRAKIDRSPDDAAMKWTISCAPDGAVLATVTEGGPAPWRGFSAALQVPADGCPAQWLRLKGTIGSTYSVASGWFDDLRVVPAGASSAVAERADADAAK